MKSYKFKPQTMPREKQQIHHNLRLTPRSMNPATRLLSALPGLGYVRSVQRSGAPVSNIHAEWLPSVFYLVILEDSEQINGSTCLENIVKNVGFDGFNFLYIFSRQIEKHL